MKRPYGTNKIERLKLRVSPQEKEAITREAKKRNMSVSAYIRNAVIQNTPLHS